MGFHDPNGIPKDIKKILGSVDSEFDEELANTLASELQGKTIQEVIAEGKKKLEGRLSYAFESIRIYT